MKDIYKQVSRSNERYIQIGFNAHTAVMGPGMCTQDVNVCGAQEDYS